MKNSKPVVIHILKNNEYDHINKIQPASFSYKNAIGSIMSIANNTRPDITLAVHFPARSQITPQDIHFIMMKRIFYYLQVIEQ